jgi:hypothetical protein
MRGNSQGGEWQANPVWNDVWITSSSLRLGFPRLYGICYSQNASVSEYAALNWQIDFRRMMGNEEFEEWTKL